MKSNTISGLSKTILILSGIGLFVCMFVPIWWIYLWAPQYPEGLNMYLYSDQITGDLDKINPLNHYIGMKKINASDFWEFTYMNYILAFYGILCILAAFIKKRSFLYFVMILFLLFGIGFMTDFWYWEYDYGHTLADDAAIKIPGMSYQPPLIGPKDLLNFKAASWPHLGGSIMFAVGVLLFLISVKEFKTAKKEY